MKPWHILGRIAGVSAAVPLCVSLVYTLVVPAFLGREESAREALIQATALVTLLALATLSALPLRYVGAVLDRMDLTEVVLERVELGRVINGALDQIDLNDLVRTRVDLASIAEEVIDDVDLPEIIRDSTTGVAGAVVDGTRLRAVEGDELVNRLVDRILLRRKARRTAAAGASLDEDTTLFGARPGEYAERIEETAQRQRAESEREAHEHHDVPDEARAADDTADDTAEGETRA